MLDTNKFLTTDVEALSFEFFNPEDLELSAACQIKTSTVFDDKGAYPAGLHDPALGNLDSKSSCVTCGCRHQCPGHLGFIKLPLPLYNILMLPSLQQLLQCVCLGCCRLKVSKQQYMYYLTWFRLIEQHDITALSRMSRKHPQTDCLRNSRSELAKRCCKLSQSQLIVEKWNLAKTQFFDDTKSVSLCPHCGRSQRTKIRIHPSKASLLFQLNATAADLSSHIHLVREHADDVGQPKGKLSRVFQFLAFQIVDFVTHLWKSLDAKLLHYLFPSSIRGGPGIFFFHSLSVPANQFRPLSQLSLSHDSESKTLHYQTAAFHDIMLHVEKLQYSLLSEHAEDEESMALNKQHHRNYKIVMLYAQELQSAVNGLIDSSTAPVLRRSQKSTNPGIRQWIEKKEGAIRQKMMGKRVNFSARTVIAPDNCLQTNEIGVPLKFAKHLTVPEYVTPQSLKALQQYVINGSKKHPGANWIEDENGKLYNLSVLSLEQRTRQAQQLMSCFEKGFCPKIVHRHVQNGDLVLMNRQPSLHRASMMGHYVRLLKGWKIFRLMYVNCSSYNADFDGDEMNLHMLQDPMGQSEAKYIANADCQYVTPKNGDLLRGLIQDHVIGATLLTNRSTYLTRRQFEHLVYFGMADLIDSGPRLQFDSLQSKNPVTIKPSPKHAPICSQVLLRVHQIPPAIWKPEPLWTGKQVITAIIKTVVDQIAMQQLHDNRSKFLYEGINFMGRSKVGGNEWNGFLDDDNDEETVVIRHSELLQGVFDKAMIGSSVHGFVHFCYEILGPNASGMLLGIFAKVFTAYLQIRGFSTNPADLILTAEAEYERTLTIQKCVLAGNYLQEKIIHKLSERASSQSGHPGMVSSHPERSVPFEGSISPSDEGRKVKIEGSQCTLKKEMSKKRHKKVDFETAQALCRYVHRHLIESPPFLDAMSPEDVAKAIQLLIQCMLKSSPANQLQLLKYISGSQALQCLFPKLFESSKSSPGQLSSCIASEFAKAVQKHRLLELDHHTNQALGEIYTEHYESNFSRLFATFNRHLYASSWLKALSPKRSVATAMTASFSNLPPNVAEYLTLNCTMLTNQKLQELISRQYGKSAEKFLLNVDQYIQASMGKLLSLATNFVKSGTTLHKFPNNGFMSMILAGAKGSRVNFSMICAMLSQQSLEGKRIPRMSSYKTLPSFARFDAGSRASGLITDRYFTGLRPQEYFFHCMAGRESLLDTAIKTSRSGYLQRCIIKGMEGLVAHYDRTVRDSDRSIIQFQYGEDGLDVTKMAFLRRPDNLIRNPALVQAKFLPLLQSYSGPLHLDQSKAEPAPFFDAWKDQIDCVLAQIDSGSGEKRDYSHVPASHYLTRMQCEPGEAVGSVAAQSIGEPATQMTLNTFHLAGHGGSNVTLGIPRLKEILQLGGQTKTPKLYIPLVSGSGQTRHSTQKIFNALRAISLLDVIHSVGVETRLLRQAGTTPSHVREYELTIQFENLAEFCRVNSSWTPTHILTKTLDVGVQKIIKYFNALVEQYTINHAETLQYEDEDELDLLVQLHRSRHLSRQQKRGLRRQRTTPQVSQDEPFAPEKNTAGFADLLDDQDDPLKDEDDLENVSDSGENTHDKINCEKLSKEDPKTDLARSEDEGEVSESTNDSSSSLQDEETDQENLFDPDDDDQSCADDHEGDLSDHGETTQTASEAQGSDVTVKCAKLKASTCRYLTQVRVCCETWRIVVVLEWATKRFPRRVIFLKGAIEILKKCMLQDTPGVANPKLVLGKETETKQEAEMQLDGTNFNFVHALSPDIVQHTKILSNHIAGVLAVYGVEACRRVLLIELLKVFSTYGINIDNHHLSLVADYMTYTGAYRVFNRSGIRYHSSPLLQMSFETPMKFLTYALERGAYDQLNGPSGAVMTGKLSSIGSGLCDILMKWKD